MAYPKATTRCRPLYTCALSILAIAFNFYTRVTTLNGPIGSVTRRIAKLGSQISPLIYTVQYQWLTILSFTDDQILALEKMIEIWFAPSSHVFNKIDDLVRAIESLPKKIDEGITEFPALVHEVPCLDWAVVHAIKWLELVISTLTMWEMDSAKEKDIMVDVNCNREDENNVIPHQNACVSIKDDTFRGSDVSNSAENSPLEVGSTAKCSYKEALERGVQEYAVNKARISKEEGKKEGAMNQISKEGVKEGNIGEKRDEKNAGVGIGDVGVSEEGSILELFDAGWQKPNVRSSMTRSASYA